MLFSGRCFLFDLIDTIDSTAGRVAAVAVKGYAFYFLKVRAFAKVN
jgi:hypothetical protein